jgi:hypothetical protein
MTMLSLMPVTVIAPKGVLAPWPAMPPLEGAPGCHRSDRGQALGTERAAVNLSVTTRRVGGTCHRLQRLTSSVVTGGHRIAPGSGLTVRETGFLPGNVSVAILAATAAAVTGAAVSTSYCFRCGRIDNMSQPPMKQSLVRLHPR